MEFRGSVSAITRDYLTGKCIISFQSDRDIDREEYEKLRDTALDIKAVKHREKRSLDANAYFHVLVGKIADTLGISKPRCKNILICRYGQYEMIDDIPVTIKTNIPPEDMLEQETLHCLPVGAPREENSVKVNFYRVYRGSHTYNTKEMSILIDGAVQEAKELGIETIPPAELERMLSVWERKRNPQ